MKSGRGLVIHTSLVVLAMTRNLVPSQSTVSELQHLLGFKIIGTSARSVHKQAIGQLDAGFQPSRNKKVVRCQIHFGEEGGTSTMNAAHQQGSPSSFWSSSPTAATRGAASQVGLRAISPSGNTDNTSSSLFSGGCQHFDSLKKAGKMQKLNVLFAPAVHGTTPYSFRSPNMEGILPCMFDGSTA
jgi:hypothetical protein